MSKLKDVILTIEEMIVENPHMDLEEIAEILEVDVDLVQSVYETIDPEVLDYAEAYDGQPTEYEEWMSFDPDC